MPYQGDSDGLISSNVPMCIPIHAPSLWASVFSGGEEDYTLTSHDLWGKGIQMVSRGLRPFKTAACQGNE